MSLIYDCAGLAGAEPQTWGTGLMNNIVFVGLNVHKATIAVAVTAEALKDPLSKSRGIARTGGDSTAFFMP
jgi:hypothetical protein